MKTAVSGLPAGHGTATALRTLYGEGLRRAFLQLSPEQDRFTGWRGRLGLLVLAAAAPVLVFALLGTSPLVAPPYAAGGGRLLLRIVIASHVVWILVSTALVLIFRFVAAGRITRRALLTGGSGTGAVLSGFLQGFCSSWPSRSTGRHPSRACPDSEPSQRWPSGSTYCTSWCSSASGRRSSSPVSEYPRTTGRGERTLRRVPPGPSRPVPESLGCEAARRCCVRPGEVPL